MRRIAIPFLLVTLWISPAWSAGEMLKHEPVVPAGMDFIRSVDVDLFAGETNRQHLGMQSGRVRVRLLDPDVNAFVGMAVGVHHFNQDLRLGDPQGPDTAGVLCNWGGVFGLVRGRHLWELDLLGSALSERLGFAPAIVGEHRLAEHWVAYHRTELNIFTGDAILDADQGLYWMWKPWLGASVGYRWFTSQHMDQSGPHVGVRLFFESPKIPFIFPSLG
jgi:hypothetical protein